MPRNEAHGTAATIRCAQLASVLLLGCVSLAIAADKTAQQLKEVSDEFLEYLGSLEGNDESWMDFAVDPAVMKEPAKPQAQSNTGKLSDSKVASASSSSSSRTLPQTASVNTSAASQTGKVEK